MRIGNFAVLIPEGVEGGSGHVELAHGQVYSIRLQNCNQLRRADAEVKIDGKEVGNFRLNVGCSVTLERGAEDRGRFTFFEVGSEEAQQAEVSQVSKEDRGLVQVTFRPEKRVQVMRSSPYGGANQVGEWVNRTLGGEMRDYTSRSLGEETKTCGGLAVPHNTSAGITGLTGRSDQSFVQVANLDYDETATVIITLRLVCGKAVRPLKSIKRSNPVPSPVE